MRWQTPPESEEPLCPFRCSAFRSVATTWLQSAAMTTTTRALGDLDETGMKEVRPGVWALRVYLGGRSASGAPLQKRKTVDSGTGRVGGGVREARAELAKMRAEIREDGGMKRVAPTGTTVAKLLDRYIAHCEHLDRSPTTIREYRRIAAKVIGPRLGKVKVTDLDQDDLDVLYAALKAKGLKATSIRRVHALMSSSLAFGMKKRLVKYNVASLASPPPVRQAVVEAPTVEQVQAIVTVAERKGDHMLATLAVVAALTGARRGELCALRWSDIDFDTKTLTISASVYRGDEGEWLLKDPKTHQRRRVGLDEVALGRLRQHHTAALELAQGLGLGLPQDAFVFTESPQGLEPVVPDLITTRFRLAAKTAGVKAHFHGLRHYMATQAFALGANPVTVSKRLGHADPSTTLRTYAHAVDERDRDLAANLGAGLGVTDGA